MVTIQSITQYSHHKTSISSWSQTLAAVGLLVVVGRARMLEAVAGIEPSCCCFVVGSLDCCCCFVVVVG